MSRFSYSVVHGESSSLYACGDSNFPQAITFWDLISAQRVTAKANDAEAYKEAHGSYPRGIGGSTWDLIKLCNAG